MANIRPGSCHAPAATCGMPYGVFEPSFDSGKGSSTLYGRDKKRDTSTRGRAHYMVGTPNVPTPSSELAAPNRHTSPDRKGAPAGKESTLKGVVVPPIPNFIQDFSTLTSLEKGERRCLVGGLGFPRAGFPGFPCHSWLSSS